MSFFEIARRVARGGRQSPPAFNVPRQSPVELQELADFSDRGALQDRIREAASYYYLGDRTGLAFVLSRYKLFVTTDDYGIAPHLIHDGFWEIWNTAFICRTVKPGSRVIEIGANLGYFSVLFSDLVGPAGRVVSFEPQARLASLLARSQNVNGFSDRSEVVSKAVADTEGERKLYVPEGNFGGASISGHYAGKPTVSVDSVRLDDWCAKNNFIPDFIKIDAEGSELSIMAGMKGLLDSGQPMQLMFEFESGRSSVWRAALIEIEEKGFTLGRVDTTSHLSPISARDTQFATGDLFEIFCARA